MCDPPLLEISAVSMFCSSWVDCTNTWKFFVRIISWGMLIALTFSIIGENAYFLTEIAHLQSTNRIPADLQTEKKRKRNTENVN